MPQRHVHLVGSVPLADAREQCSKRSVRRSGRGFGGFPTARPANAATGSRISNRSLPTTLCWRNPTRCFRPASDRPRPYTLPAPGPVSPADIRFDNLLYADTAIRSYAEFAQLKQQGVIPAQCRFQVDLCRRIR